MSQDQLITFEALDTLMFRDGRPFNQSDAGASRAVSVFPPYPPTVVGAIRAALWKQAGGDWNSEKFGTGTDWQDSQTTLGPLAFGAPLLFRSVADKKKRSLEPFFPVPLHLVEGRDPVRTEKPAAEKTPTFLAPSDSGMPCDLGRSVRLPLPQLALEEVKPIEDRWVSLSGMKAILSNNCPKPEHFIKCSALWQVEQRVGIGISEETRTTDDGRLYMASHIRMADGVRLGLNVSGSDPIKPTLQALAGEHRMALVSAEQITTLPETPDPKRLNKNRYCVVQISPLLLNAMPDPGGKLGDLPGTLVSACLGKMQSIGGWDSVRCKPIPLRRAIPAGSVWFMELGSNELADWQASTKGLGLATEWGFGQFLIGNW